MVRGGVLLTILCLFLFRGVSQQQEFDAIRQIPEGTSITVTGTVYKKEFKKDDYLYYLKDVLISSNISNNVASDKKEIETSHVILRISQGDDKIGSRICFKSAMRWMDQATNTGGFDERKYYHSLGITTLLYGKDSENEDGPISQSDSSIIFQKKSCPVRNGLFFLREKLRNIYQDSLNENDAGILSAMVLGDKTLMEEELKSLYSIAGISHILAVSGLHVSMIGMTIFQFLRKRRLKYPVSCLVSGITLMLFCIMSGLSVSAIRAGIMFLIYLGAQLLGRKYDSFRGMAVAAFITLLWNPSAIYNAGFLFSYFAVAGAVGLGNLFPFDKKKKGSAIFQSMWLSSSIMMTTMPLNAYFFYEVPLYGVVANLLVLPLAGVLMGFGLLGGLICLSGLPGMWIFFFPCHAILRFYEWICQGIAWLPAETFITGQPKMGVLILYYAVLIAAVVLIKTRENSLRSSVDKLTIADNKLFFVKRMAVFRYTMFPIVPILCLILIFTAPLPKRFQVSFLDVGQGDGIYINNGEGNAFFIDGGSTSEKQLGKYQLLPFLKANRVRKIDMWFVTHADEDHVNGLMEVLEAGYKVETIVISENMPEDENKEALVDLVEISDTRILETKTGDCIIGENYEILFLAPDAGDEERNENSLVLALTYEGSSYQFLFTGDIGQEQENWLLKQPQFQVWMNRFSEVEGNEEPQLILKSAHHGSKYSNSKSFLEDLQPDFVVISAGKNNLYGHPHQETLDRIAEVGSVVMNTIDIGEITFKEKCIDKLGK